eukprot:3406666-Rhodomonas_salina.3
MRVLCQNCADVAYGATSLGTVGRHGALSDYALSGTTDTNVREDITDRFEEWNEDGTRPAICYAAIT